MRAVIIEYFGMGVVQVKKGNGFRFLFICVIYLMESMLVTKY